MQKVWLKINFDEILKKYELKRYQYKRDKNWKSGNVWAIMSQCVFIQTTFLTHYFKGNLIYFLFIKQCYIYVCSENEKKK